MNTSFALLISSLALLAACQTITIDGDLPPTELPRVGCPGDARICPDGTSVSREAPDCEFAACPEEDTPKDPQDNEPIIQQDYCVTASDCVAATCCHPTKLVNKEYAPNCVGVACTMSCEGPLDCGAGTSACLNNKCVIKSTVSTTKQKEESSIIEDVVIINDEPRPSDAITRCFDRHRDPLICDLGDYAVCATLSNNDGTYETKTYNTGCDACANEVVTSFSVGEC